MLNQKIIQKIGGRTKLHVVVLRNYCTEKYHATCFPGLEIHLKHELEQIKEIHSIQETTAGVSFQTTTEHAYEINLKSRVALRILQHITEGDLDVSIRGGDAVYEFTKTKVDWLKYYNTKNDGYISVNARLHECDYSTSSHLIEKRVRDAICDQIKDKTGKRPSPPFQNNNKDEEQDNFGASYGDSFGQNKKNGNEKKEYFIDLPVFVIAYDNKFSIFRDMSGESLHHRFYKSGIIHQANLNETWAAGILYKASWPEKVKQYGSKITLMDPMCGSGTLLLEALLMACNIPPAVLRENWPFQRWPDYREDLWLKVLKRTNKEFTPFYGNIVGSDISAHSIKLANGYLDGLWQLKNYCPNIYFRVGDCVSWDVEKDVSEHFHQKISNNEKERSQNKLIAVTNPPWGLRLRSEPTEEIWKDLGFFLKNNIGGGEAWVLTGNKKSETTRHLGLKATTKTPLKIGGLQTVLVNYNVLPKWKDKE